MVKLCAAAVLMGVLGFSAVAAGAPPAVVKGQVVAVADGNRLSFQPLAAGAPVAVRLRDIEAPESCQPWGAEARSALAEKALKQPAELRASGRRDAQGRTLAAVSVDGVDLSRWMVEEGHAFSVRGRDDHGPLVKQERMARALARGLHAAAGSLPPAEFRRLHGRCPAAGGK